MAKPEDPRLTRMTKICLGFPEAEREIHASHAIFKIRKKVFAYYQDDHHGDGIVGLICKALPGDNVELIRSDPARFYMPAYIGSKGWVGFRLDTAKIEWDEVQEMVAYSYRRTAPKALAARV